MTVIIHELEVVPRQDSPKASAGAAPPQSENAPATALGPEDLARLLRAARARSLRCWAH